MKTQLKCSLGKGKRYVVHVQHFFSVLIFSLMLLPAIGQTALMVNTTVLAENDQIFDIATDTKDNDEKLDFINNYDIDENKGFNGKILFETTFLKEPSKTSEYFEDRLTQGQLVYVYKLCNTVSGFYAIESNGHYGFVQMASVMAISNRTVSYYNPEYDTPPELISLIRPKYPKDARKENITGSVLVKAFINKKGIVEKTEISKGIDQLNEAAMYAVKKAKFKPAENKGKPVSIWIDLSIDFE